MAFQRTRRGFLQLMGAGGLAAAAGTGQEAHGDTPHKSFKGTSKRGNYGDALQQAIEAAERSVRHPDALVEWSLKNVSGRRGGFAGFNEITVTIEATVH